jgi:hypothetical protein
MWCTALLIGTTSSGVITDNPAQYNIEYKFGDDTANSLGMPPQTRFVNNLPHTVKDKDGYMWSSVMAFVPKLLSQQGSFDS